MKWKGQLEWSSGITLKPMLNKAPAKSCVSISGVLNFGISFSRYSLLPISKAILSAQGTDKLTIGEERKYKLSVKNQAKTVLLGIGSDSSDDDEGWPSNTHNKRYRSIAHELVDT